MKKSGRIRYLSGSIRAFRTAVVQHHPAADSSASVPGIWRAFPAGEECNPPHLRSSTGGVASRIDSANPSKSTSLTLLVGVEGAVQTAPIALPPAGAARSNCRKANPAQDTRSTTDEAVAIVG